MTHRRTVVSNLSASPALDRSSIMLGGVDPASPLEAGREPYVSGVFEKGRPDTSKGWGLVVLAPDASTSTVKLVNGAVIGTGPRTATLQGPGVAAEHARVHVRWDGCYLEDLSTSGGTFVNGVRARLIDVAHGAVVRLGDTLAVFVERDLSAYDGAMEAVSSGGDLWFGPKQWAGWLTPFFRDAANGAWISIEGGPGLGKRGIAMEAAARRGGKTVVIDAVNNGDAVDTRRGADRRLDPSNAGDVATWVVLGIDRLQKSRQMDLREALGGSRGAVITTSRTPLEQLSSDRLMPWLASQLQSHRVKVPSLDERREDIAGIARAILTKHDKGLTALSASWLEALLRARWSRGVPELEAVLVSGLVNDDRSTLPRAHLAAPLTLHAQDEDLARARLDDAIQRAEGSVAEAARKLNLSRQAVYREAERLGLAITRRK